MKEVLFVRVGKMNAKFLANLRRQSGVTRTEAVDNLLTFARKDKKVLKFCKNLKRNSAKRSRAF